MKQGQREREKGKRQGRGKRTWEDEDGILICPKMPRVVTTIASPFHTESGVWASPDGAKQTRNVSTAQDAGTLRGQDGCGEWFVWVQTRQTINLTLTLAHMEWVHFVPSCVRVLVTVGRSCVRIEMRSVGPTPLFFILSIFFFVFCTVFRWTKSPGSVSYTHLTLPTNAEV